MIKILKYLVILSFFIVSTSQAEVLNLSSQELLTAQKEGAVIIDIRTPQEWSETGTIPNANRIMFFNEKRTPLINEFMSEFQKLVTKKDQAFVLVCRTGSRTGSVTKFLDQKFGYTNVAHLKKGMKQWKKEKHDVEF